MSKAKKVPVEIVVTKAKAKTVKDPNRLQKLALKLGLLRAARIANS